MGAERRLWGVDTDTPRTRQVMQTGSLRYSRQEVCATLKGGGGHSRFRAAARGSAVHQHEIPAKTRSSPVALPVPGVLLIPSTASEAYSPFVVSLEYDL